MLPLFEAKMIHLYDTRWATYEQDGSTRLMADNEKANHHSPMARYWVHEDEIDRKLAGRWDQNWFLGWRRIARSTDERTLIATRLPRVALGDSIFVALSGARGDMSSFLQACLGSHVLDFVMRQKMGGTNASFYLIEQLPVPSPMNLMTRIGEPMDRHLQEGVAGKVDRLNGWISDSADRARTSAELDAAAFHLYGLTRDEVSYVMDTFPIVKRKDEAAFGSFRTKELILSVYDAMAEAKASGHAYQPPWPQEVHG